MVWSALYFKHDGFFFYHKLSIGKKQQIKYFKFLIRIFTELFV